MKTASSMIKSVIISLMIGVLAVGCANENSNETQAREKRDRERARNQNAEGSYSGYLVKRGTGARVPFRMDVAIIENTTNSSVSLQASLTVGLFGGVAITTNSVLYDRGSGELDVFFSQSASAQPDKSTGETSTVRIKATIQNKAIVNGTLRGAKSGMFDFDVHTSDTQFDTDNDVQLLTKFKTQKGKQSEALVTLTHRLDPQPSKPGMDLPQLPPLAANLQFESLGDAPMGFTQALYDPLKGEIELDFQNSNRIVLRNVFLPPSTKADKLTHLDGNLYQGGTLIAVVGTDLVKGPQDIKMQPPSNYVGTFTSPQGNSTRVVATLVPDGTVRNNPGNSIFPLFPGMQLIVLSCGLGAKIPFYLTRIEQVEGDATFTGTATGRIETFNASVTTDWNSIKGYVTFQSPSSTSRYKLDLKAQTSGAGCQ